jgi:hypothetical protein
MQRTSFNGKYSQPRGINLGVPQGSVLGLMMFIIYMNDIGSAIKQCQYYLFADDTLLSVSGNSVKKCLAKLNRDLENLSKWLKFNKLKLNVSKTKYLIMTERRSSIENGSMSLTIDGEQKARVASMKYLGVESDEKLNLKQHVDTTEENRKESWQNYKYNHLPQYYFTTPGFLLLDSLSLQRKGFESSPSDPKQGNEYNSEIKFRKNHGIFFRLHINENMIRTF